VEFLVRVNMDLESCKLNALPKDLILDRYRINSVLGHGTFGITYLAKHTRINSIVAIKEFFPIDYASRNSSYYVTPYSENQLKDMYQWGLERFLFEARTLTEFNDHPNIVNIIDYFEAFGTAYLVMPYEKGHTFFEWLKKNPKPTEQQLMNIFMPILNGLEFIHQKSFLHRDIKPSNIYIRSDNHPLLIDFGAARTILGKQEFFSKIIITAGFSPVEQYRQEVQLQGAWTDIYATAATLWQAISGKQPPDAEQRGNAHNHGRPDPLLAASSIGKEHYSKSFLEAIDWGLSPLKKDRPQSVKEWKRSFLKKNKETDYNIQHLTTPLPFKNKSNKALIKKDKQESSVLPKLRAKKGQRYYDNHDGTIIDLETELMWKKRAEINSRSGKFQLYNWNQAIQYAQLMKFIGYHDWRLPTRNELMTLISKTTNKLNARIDDHYFPDTKPAQYWSASEVSNRRTHAWFIYFGDGSKYWTDKRNHLYIRLVRNC